MPLTTKRDIVNDVSSVIDTLLITQLVDEYISLENRYTLGDWEPAELDGGQFCEIASRIIYAADSKNTNLSKPLDDCLKYITNQNVPHHMEPRRDALHIEKVLRCIYKFRSQRGAVHISPDYTPNAMDARFVAEGVRWCFAELLRIFWQGDRALVARAIREILQFSTPAIGVFGDRLLVQRTDLHPEEEILVLLHHAGEEGLSRRDLGRFAELEPPSVTRSLQKLANKSHRQITQIDDKYRLTDLGSKRIRLELTEKLQLQ